MKSLCTLIPVGIIAILIFLSGCDLITAPPKTPVTVGTPRDLIISEVFTISPDRYYAYSWLELFNPTNRPISLVDISFPVSGYSVGANGTLLKTTDDGVTWMNVSESGISASFNSTSFSWPDTGFAVGDGGAIYRIIREESGNYHFIDLSVNIPPTAAGKNFYKVYSPLQTPLVFVVGQSGTILRAVNQGKNPGDWVHVPHGLTTRNLRGLSMVDYNRVYVAGDGGVLMKGTVGGRWEMRTPPLSQISTNYHSITAVSDTAWAVGEGGAIAFTTNQGIQWIAQTSTVSTTLRSVFNMYLPGVTVTNLGWIVGDNGVVLKTTNYGEKWEKKESGTSASLYEVRFADPLNGWAFGDGGVIIRTSDGGEHWSPQRSPISYRLTSSAFFPPTKYVLSFYQLAMWAQKHHFFYDQATNTTNLDVLTDTLIGTVTIFPPEFDIVVPSNGFLIISNDSSKFKSHTDLGPGEKEEFHLPLAVGSFLFGGSRRLDSIIVPLDVVIWKLPVSGEIRLEKLFVAVDIQSQLVDTASRRHEVVDLVRWGNFMPNPGEFEGDVYPNNQPLGFIPEWYSIARFANDYGGDVSNSSSVNSFYFSDRPIPGYYSQRNRP